MKKYKKMCLKNKGETMGFHRGEERKSTLGQENLLRGGNFVLVLLGARAE